MGIDNALVEYGIREVVYKHLYADVCWARVFLLLGSRVLLFPFGFSQAAQYVPLANVFHYVLYGFLYGSFTYALASHQYVHEGGLMVHVVPVAP